MFIQISEKLKNLAKFFPENLYVVGGYVRNKLLGIETSDIDIASSVDIEQVIKRLKGSEYSVKIKNLRLGSITIFCDNELYEYTAFRKEKYPNDGSHSPILIEPTDKLEEDAVRRDFSVNSIYYNINKDIAVDLFHGIVDINQKIMRCNIDPDEVLCHDGERILRLVRFCGELGFEIEKKTLKSAIKFSSNIKNLSGERKFSELEKILYCDKRYEKVDGDFKRAIKLLNLLGVWRYYGLNCNKIKYKMVYKCQDRFLGLLIDMVDTAKPECLEVFVENALKTMGFSEGLRQKTFEYLAGYYSALNGMKNKEYFFKYYQYWAFIYPLLGAKSKRLQTRYNFFYQYIIEHGLVIEKTDLAITESDIQENFPNIDKRNYDKILENLLSKVFDGKLENDKQFLLKEIKKNLQNF